MTPTDPWLTLATRQVDLRASYTSHYWPNEDVDYPVEWSGWCDPTNPWGTADRDQRDPNFEYDDHPADDEPIVETLSLVEAVDFIAEFPGAVWDLWEGEASQDFRTGVDTSVTLIVSDYDDPLLPYIFHLAGEAQKRADRHLRNRNLRLWPILT